ncbi:hypothetical protein [Pseudoalteromonas sp.]|uniref:hypothetical protein n=1 Tax=Pseudoalteromonas sp. TaxID=53249 RepID=UPI0035672EF1
MFLTEFFGLFSLSAFASWGFMMAFFFNIFIYTLGVKRNTTLLLSSFIMMGSYFASDYFFTWLSVRNSVYLDWALYDYATIAILALAYLVIKKTTPSYFYIILGLALNSIFSLCMYIDIYVNQNTTPWFFWDIYTFSVNIIDLFMIVALIVDRDFLALHKLKNKILSLHSYTSTN